MYNHVKFISQTLAAHTDGCYVMTLDCQCKSIWLAMNILF